MGQLIGKFTLDDATRRCVELEQFSICSLCTELNFIQRGQNTIKEFDCERGYSINDVSMSDCSKFRLNPDYIE